MHLATCSGITCVSIFSAINKPGVWFPFGNENYTFYNKVSCFNCRLETCSRHDKFCIMSITPSEVSELVLSLLL